MNKKSALFIGNCQNWGVIHFLNKSEDFVKNFQIINYTNWQLIENKCEIPMADIKSADLFIYQPLRKVHGCYSTDPTIKGSIGYYVKDECIKITYPYIFSSAMWPIVQAKENENRWFGGEVIDNLVRNGFTKDQIVSLFLSNKIDWNYHSRFNESLKILKNKESITDIKVSSFILENLTNELLFLIPQHPTSIIFWYVANQILDRLNFKKLEYDIIDGVNDPKIADSTYHIPSGMFPLHQSSIHAYNLNYGEKYLESSTEFYLQRIVDYLAMNYSL